MMIKELLQQKKGTVISIAVFALLCTVLFSRWFLTPLVNHFAEPYNARLEQVKLNWFPLMVQLKGLEIGKGASALQLDQLDAEANWGLLVGDPITVQVRGGKLQLGYQGEKQIFAGLTLDEWQALLAGDPATQEENAPKEKGVEDPDQLPVNFILQQLMFEQIQINSEQKNWPTVTVKQLSFGPLALRQPDKRSDLALTIDIAEGQIGVQAQIAPLALQTPQKLQLDLQQLKLNPAWFVMVPAPLATELSAKLDLALNEKGTDLATVKGHLDLKQLQWRDSSNQVKVAGVKLDQIDLAYNLQGELAPPAKIPLQGGLNLVVDQVNISTEDKQSVQFQRLNLNELRYNKGVNLQQLVLDKLQVTDPDNQLRLARLALNEISAEPGIPKAAFKRLQVDGIEASAQQHSARISVLSLNNLVADLSTSSINLAQLTANKVAANSDENQIQLNTLAISNVVADLSKPWAQFAQLSIDNVQASSGPHQAEFQVLTLADLAADFDTQALTLNELQLNALTAKSEGKNASVKQLSVNKIAAGMDGQNASVNQLQIDGLQFEDDSNQVSNERLTLKDVLFEQVLDISSIDLANLKARTAGQDYQLQQLAVRQVSFDPTSHPMNAHIAEVLLNNAKAEVQIPKQEKVEQSAPVNQGPGKKDSNAKPEKDTEVVQGNQTGATVEEPPVYLTLDLLQVKQHQVLFQDHNLAEATQTEFKLELFELENLRWPSAEQAQWKLDAWLDGQSQWMFSGTASTQPITVSAKGKQKGLSLPAISPYSEHYAQVFFKQGVMDNKVNLDWQGQHLKGEIGFLMHGLDIKLDGEFSNQNTPLQMALSVLRDSKDRIDLAISVDKSGEQLNVSAGEIIREFIFSASQKGALAYLKYTLQPFGALLTLADVGGKLMKGGAVPLEGIVYDNQQVSLKPAQLEYANKLLTMLKERRKMKLQTCVQLGTEERELFMTELKGDTEKVEKAMLELQQGRIREWRRFFAQGGVANQLMECAKAQPDAPQMTYKLMLVPQ
ncbi:MAG: hypothetical protein CMI12_07000 [Oceanospirillum sp.]|nr:hypothetical protein [Oceanospirillum sp.]